MGLKDGIQPWIYTKFWPIPERLHHLKLQAITTTRQPHFKATPKHHILSRALFSLTGLVCI